MNPVVSVLLLTYNHNAYINQAISSVLEQVTSFDYEILIGDDCSNDGTELIVKEFEKKYLNKIRLITSETNVGAVKNERRIIEASKGKYLAFLEGDDFWIDTYKLQKQVDFLEANPECGLVHGDVNHYYEDLNKTDFQINKSKGIVIKNGNLFHELLKPNPVFIKTATTCFRKNLLLEYFDYDLAINESWPLTDLPIWMDISAHSTVHYFDEVFATYRLLNESTSRTLLPLKKYEYHVGLFKIKQHYIKKYNCSENTKIELEEEYYRGLIKIAYNLNDIKLVNEAISYLKRNNRKITAKEKLMRYLIKNKLIKKMVQFVK